jgi:uncharacterized protein with HEPN domain
MAQPRRLKGPGGGRYLSWQHQEAEDVELSRDVDELLKEASAEAVDLRLQARPPKDEADREERLTETLSEMARAMDAAAMIVVQGTDALAPFSHSRLAAERLVEMVAEQAKRLPERFRTEHSGVAWGLLIGMRNRISHGYGDDIDRGLLWDALTVDLPQVRQELGI